MNAWVYYLLGESQEVIYVGSSKNPWGRLAAHKNSSSFFGEINGIRIVGPMTKGDADLLEGREIIRLDPKYNKNVRRVAAKELCGPYITKGDYNALQKKASAPRVNRIKRLRRGGLSWGGHRQDARHLSPESPAACNEGSEVSICAKARIARIGPPTVRVVLAPVELRSGGIFS